MNTDLTRAFSTSTVSNVTNSVTDVYTNLQGMQALKSEKNDDVALKKVAQQFESMFINMLLKNMREANKVFNEDGLFDSQESDFYQGMHDNQLALTMAHGKGFGIAEAMYRQLSSSYNSKDHGLTRQVQQSVPVYPEKLPTDIPEVSEAVRLHLEEKIPTSVSALPIINERQALADSPKDFIDKVKQGARIAARVLGVDDEILIAQAALETGWGQHVFTKENGESSFNLFNIKADRRWQGHAVNKNTLEYLGGQFTSLASKFRAYTSIEDSFEDFSRFIQTNPRYDNAKEHVSSPLDFIKSIHQSGYATDPKYVEKVTAVYKQVKALLVEEVKATEIQVPEAHVPETKVSNTP